MLLLATFDLAGADLERFEAYESAIAAPYTAWW